MTALVSGTGADQVRISGQPQNRLGARARHAPDAVIE
jgi:hypothetical protein